MSDEFWFEWLIKHPNKNFILEKISEIYDLLDEKPIILTKHFFWEPDGFHFRIESKSERDLLNLKTDVQRLIEKSFSEEEIENNPYSYNGEIEDWFWGEQKCTGYGIAWPLVKMIYDASCQLKLVKEFHYEEIRSYDERYNLNKRIVHCILNHQFNGNPNLEREFHLNNYKEKCEQAIAELKNVNLDILDMIYSSETISDLKEKLESKYKIA